ncbi:hypothetical protein HYH03_001620 [Edaphochlamys debaryana]|uniref:Uncharacterized protein n=1 Tax=Edaphochlamys debaryana TaxID=47281 RepID=A0A836C6F2_9CHLO|nr:hypothetical protein HYH03_001620 [Edaphochlamys debaryana]|eukprot:KAG2500859.1 hypothetical protein HYH03_001620 [Edaphochlamys debaryana]
MQIHDGNTLDGDNNCTAAAQNAGKAPCCAGAGNSGCGNRGSVCDLTITIPNPSAAAAAKPATSAPA